MVQHFGEELALITKVHEGMSVIDATGETIGTIETVQMGDPGAETPRGEVWAPDVPFLGIEDLNASGPFARRLLRTGFIKVSRKGLFTHSVYVAADHIATVGEDEVRISIGPDKLVPEA